MKWQADSKMYLILFLKSRVRISELINSRLLSTIHMYRIYIVEFLCITYVWVLGSGLFMSDCICGGQRTTFPELVLSFAMWNRQIEHIEHKVVRFGLKCFYLLNHLTGPNPKFYIVPRRCGGLMPIHQYLGARGLPGIQNYPETQTETSSWKA